MVNTKNPWPHNRWQRRHPQWYIFLPEIHICKVYSLYCYCDCKDLINIYRRGNVKWITSIAVDEYVHQTVPELAFNSTLHENESERWSVVSDSLRPQGQHSPWNSPRQNTGVGSHSLSRGSSQPRGQTQISHIAGRFLPSWATREYRAYYVAPTNASTLTRISKLLSQCCTWKE